MTRLGDGAFTKKKAACPFCGANKGEWTVFEHQGRHRFKCHKPGCVANEPPPDVGHGEIGYLCLRKNLSPKAAGRQYLEMAVPYLLEQQDREAKAKTKEKPPTVEAATPASGDGPPAITPPTPAQPLNDGWPSPPNPWDSLYRKLVLTPRDHAKLKSQRGFSDDTIDKLGFRSNNQSNRVHVEALRNEFSIELLLSLGIFRTYTNGVGPNRQLLGWGISKRARKDDEKDQWDWTEPVLIPYLAEDGTALSMRPHKGGIAPSTDDDDEEAPCSSHVYCPLLVASIGPAFDGTLVLCEGEYKAAALHQCGIPALAIPGTAFVRNRAFRNELLDLLRRFAVTDMVICFDKCSIHTQRRRRISMLLPSLPSFAMICSQRLAATTRGSCSASCSDTQPPPSCSNNSAAIPVFGSPASCRKARPLSRAGSCEYGASKNSPESGSIKAQPMSE